MSQAILTQARLRELFDYDPETGVMTRRISTAPRAQAGQIVGTPDGSGYLRISIGGKKFRLHRLIHMYVHGAWPEHDIDHRDRNRSNNRLLNLRPATRAENCQNSGIPAHNTSGFKGVSWSKTMHKWEARISVANHGKVLGYFKTRELASAAYQTAKLIYHPTAPVAQQGA